MIFYVDANSKNDGVGTKEAPYRRISQAATIAMPGDEIVVAPGIYREYVNPVNPGTEDNRIVYRSSEPLGAIITGAEKVGSWTKHEGDVWVTRVKNSIFGD